MGLYRIPIQYEKIETIPRLMQSIGFPVVRIESQENGIYYFCTNPKRLNRNWTFWITHEKEGCPRLFMCGLSQLSKQIVNSLNGADFFERDHSE
jgi:hypothetical protein